MSAEKKTTNPSAIRKHSKLHKLSVALWVSVAVMTVSWAMRHHQIGQTQTLASIGAKDQAAKRKRLGADDRHTEAKATTSFSMAIANAASSASASANSASTRISLTATISADKAMEQYEYNWILPRGYAVVGGPAAGQVPTIEAGGKRELTVTIDRGTEPAQPIVLHVFRLVRNEPVGQVAQFDFPSNDTTVPNKATSDAGKSIQVDSSRGYVQ